MGKIISVSPIEARNFLRTGAGTNYVIQTPSGVLYIVSATSGTSIDFSKSTDGGLTWSFPTQVISVGISGLANLSVWYDRWSGISAGLIHIAATENVNDDTLYRTIDTESSDALSTQTTIFAGGSTASGGRLSIARARGGNVYCYTCIDAGAEGGFFRLPNANVPNGAWDAARNSPEALATQDQAILVPGFAADNQDMMCIFWDASDDEISRYVYDDSANSWAETSIATSMVDAAASSGTFPHFAATVDLANSQIIMAAWSAVDTVNADLRCWTITESAITETSANVVLNSTDDQHLCAIALDTVTGYWYVFYGGKSDGSETVGTAINLYCKVSKDSGATWGAESLFTAMSADNWAGLFTIPRFFGAPKLWSLKSSSGTDPNRLHFELPARRVSVQLGI